MWTRAEFPIYQLTCLKPQPSPSTPPQKPHIMTLRKILRDPSSVPSHLLNMKMAIPSSFSGQTEEASCPTHIPDIADTEDLIASSSASSNGFRKGSKRATRSLDITPRTLIPSRPSSRYPTMKGDLLVDLPFSQLDSRELEKALKIMWTMFVYKQIQISASWKKKLQKKRRQIRIQWTCQDHVLFSSLRGNKIDTRSQREDEWEARDQLMMQPHVFRFMTTLSWDISGLASPSFCSNFFHLVATHNLDLVILTEIRVEEKNTMDIIRKLPYDSHEKVVPTGFAGVIILLWNSSNIGFTTIRKENQCIHGFVQKMVEKKMTHTPHEQHQHHHQTAHSTAGLY